MAIHAPIMGARTRAPEFSPTATRRNLLGLAAAGAVAASVASPVSLLAKPAWSARDWMNRWFALGCGLDVHGNALSLKLRLNGDAEAISAMLTEIVSAERRAGIISMLEAVSSWSRHDIDLALVAVERIEQVDREFVSEADDPAGCEAWLARWDAEANKLLWTPASTSKGIAAKIRYGVSMHSDLGDEIVQRTLAQLERRK